MGNVLVYAFIGRAIPASFKKAWGSKGFSFFPEIVFFLLISISFTSNAQTDSSKRQVVQSLNAVSEKSLHILVNKYSLLEKLVEHKTKNMLEIMEKRESALQEQMKAKDSIKAQLLFSTMQANYHLLKQKLQSYPGSGIAGSLKGYLPGLDSIQSAIKFLSQVNNIPGISNAKLLQVQAISQHLELLQEKLQVANEAQDYIRGRELQLKNELTQYGLGKQLLGINKECFYYQQQLAEYKNMFSNKEKAAQAVLGAVRQIPAFQTFWQKYSFISQLFPMPANFGTAQALNGLQTRSTIQSILQSIGGSASSNQQLMQRQVQQAQSTLGKLKDKITNFGGTSGSGDMALPDFVPNSQHTKRFLQRLEYGLSIQNASNTSLLPTISTFALTIGYKISDKATTGIGASYLMGWGKALNEIHLTSQGLGLRSFVDIKAKGGIWLTGGFEYTYYQQFAKLSNIRNLNTWQKSALIGITKKTMIGKKTANLQLLYDMLYNQEAPKGQQIKFRVGYTF